MTDYLTEDEVFTAIPGLSRTRLVTFIETEMVIPLHRKGGASPARVFRRVDVARIQLLCDLADDLELDETALGVVAALIDQLHAARQELLAIARAVAAEPPDVRARIGAAVLGAR
jgi:chaperone modulatory protein CbpM